MRRLVVLASLACLASRATAQQPVGTILPSVKAGGSANVHVLSHIPLGGFYRATDVALDQNPQRPFAYLAQSLDAMGLTVIDVSSPEKARVLWRWRVPNAERHQGLGGVKATYFASGAKTWSFFTHGAG